MSRIGRLEIAIPQKVEVSVEGGQIVVKGPLGVLVQPCFPQITLDLSANTLKLTRENDSKSLKAKHGLLRSLVANMVRGVSEGFSKTLVLNGVGYKVEQKGQNIVLILGYSTNVEYFADPSVKVQVGEGNRIIVSGFDKERVGQVAAEIRSIGPVEPYKGKKLRYLDEKVKKKVGKSGVKK